MITGLKPALKSSIGKFIRSTQLDTDRSYRLEINSAGELSISGITEIKSYDEASVLVVSQKNITEIKGSMLVVTKFSDSEISVSGEISSLNFIVR